MKRLPAVLPLIFGVLAFCTLARGCVIQLHGFGPDSDALQTHLRLDGLAFGVFLAYLYNFDPRLKPFVEKYRYQLLLVSLAMVLPAMIIDRKSEFFPSIGFTMLYVGYGCLVLVAVYTPTGKSKFGALMNSGVGRLLAFIGYYSYTIYLWHVMLAVIPMHRLVDFATNPIKWLFLTILYLTLAVGVGVVTSRIVDTPMLALRDRLYPSRARALPGDEIPA